MDWVKAGTIFTILAGLGGLIFTGVTTYYEARISAAQLNDSRDHAEVEARSQAARVTFWTDLSTHESVLMHILNRSPDPVSAVEADVTLRENGKGRDAAPIGDVAPCTELVIDLTVIETRKVALPAGITFSDSAGVRWNRTNRQLTRIKSDGGLVPEAMVPGLKAVPHAMTIKRAANCVDGSGS
jgi:hypothetical protein